jgi:aryl-alcohol dehydrogenase-like predicted oxidoreductase
MDQIELGKSGVRVSPLGIGTWAWGDNLYWGYGKGYGKADLKQAFDDTLRADINFFDTAEVYGLGKSEKFLGEFLRAAERNPNVNLRPGVHIATKFFPLPYRLSKSFLLHALRGSLKRLGLQTVDLYQMHWAFPPVSIETWMDAMAEAVEKKLTRAVGVSNYNADQVRRAHKRLAQRGIPLASNQIEYSLLHRSPDFNGVMETCRELNVTVIAYSPLKFGILTGKYSPAHPLPGARGSQFSYAYLTRVQPLLTVLQQVAEKNSKSMSQTAIRWVMQRGALPIPGAKNLNQARENAGALGWNLSDQDMGLLNDVSERSVTT